MNEETRVICLYRVSTLGQVEKNDIPMQRHVTRTPQITDDIPGLHRRSNL